MCFPEGLSCYATMTIDKVWEARLLIKVKGHGRATNRSQNNDPLIQQGILTPGPKGQLN